jgi:hypothetical protein
MASWCRDFGALRMHWCHRRHLKEIIHKRNKLALCNVIRLRRKVSVFTQIFRQCLLVVNVWAISHCLLGAF